MQAAYEIVGSVTLVGSHDDPPEGLCDPPGEVYSDPLEIAPVEYALVEMEDWKAERAQQGSEEVGPFEILISADDYHKADVSGGPPYRVPLSRPSMDARLNAERHDVLFVEYLRLSFAWGGFPGFDRAEAQPPMAILERLRRGLLEI